MIDEATLEKMADELGIDRDWLWKLPCHACRLYPISFMSHRLNLVKHRARKWWLFGEPTVLLNRRGRALRDYLEGW